MLVGCATSEGTKEYLSQKKINKISELGKTGLSISKIGFGSYRIHSHNIAHQDALKLAIRNGINVIDTSSNYMDGHSEVCIATVMKELESEEIFRKHIVIISKAGYIQGSLLNNMKEKGANLPELVKYSDSCWHSIHPEFIKSQIEISLDRLDCLKIDFFLLHNPEYFFLDKIQKSEHDNEKNRNEFYERLFRAFVQLEESVKNDKIQYYGLSSNALTLNPEYRDFIDLEIVLQKAREASMNINGHENHHFSVVQFPLNLIEQDALRFKNQKGMSVIDIAKRNNLAVMTNRPINAMTEDSVVRLAEYDCEQDRNYIPAIQKQLLALDKSEKYLEKLLIDNNYPINDDLKEKLQLSNIIDRNLDKLRSLEESQYLENQVMHVFTADLISVILAQAKPKDLVNFKSVLKLYIEILNKTFGLINEHMNQLTNSANKLFIDSNETKYKLSEFALNVLASDPDIDCVLNGMKKEEYVYEAVRINNFKYLENNREQLESYLNRVVHNV